MFQKVYSLYSAFCTQPAFYSQSAVCFLHSVCILPLVRSLRFTLTEQIFETNASIRVALQVQCNFAEEEKNIFSHSTIYKSFHFISSCSFRFKKIHFSLDSIDLLSKNSETCVFETFILFSGTNLIPVKISFILFLRNKVTGGGFNKYFKRNFSLFSPVSSLESQDTPYLGRT